MTAEQQHHQDEYYAAKRRYENAYSDKRHAENQVSAIINRRNQIISQINAKVAERNRYSDSLSRLQDSSAKNGDFDTSVRDTELKLEAASEGFSAIGESSLCKPKKLTEVFSDKNSLSKSSISNAFTKIKTISNNIQNKIAELNGQISALEREMEDGKNSERYWNGVISDKNRAMNSASWDMAYHKKYMDG